MTLQNMPLVSMMKFWEHGGVVQSRRPRKNSGRCLWYKKVILLKHGDRTHGQEELYSSWLYTTLRVVMGNSLYTLRLVGRRSGIELCSKKFWTPSFQDLEGLAVARETPLITV